MKERAQRLALFAAIEGGASFWTREITERGVQSVFERIKADAYDSIKHAVLAEKVKNFESAPTFQAIEKAGAHFLIPGDTHWPLRVDELDRERITARGLHKVIRLSWTLADLAGHSVPTLDDVGRAHSLREGTDL